MLEKKQCKLFLQLPFQCILHIDMEALGEHISTTTLLIGRIMIVFVETVNQSHTIIRKS